MNIRNIGILAHVDAGKTTLTEQILRRCGVIRSAGSVDSGDTVADSMDIERRRGISVRAAAISFMSGEVRINLIDTPGHVDFAGEVERSMTALDGAVVIIDALEGVQPHTVAIWKALDRLSLPRFIFLNKIDRAGADPEAVFSGLSRWLDGNFVRLFNVSDCGSREAKAELGSMTQESAEQLSLADDVFMEKYLDGAANEAFFSERLKKASVEGRAAPVFAGAAARDVGIDAVLWGIEHCLPSAETKEADLSAVVFRIDHDKTAGKIAHARLFGGELVTRDSPDIIRGGEPVEDSGKITQIRRFTGSKYEDTGKVSCGDIAGLCGLSGAKIGDIIGSPSKRTGSSPKLATPYLTVKAAPKDAVRLPELLAALTELSEEEPHINCRWEKTEREIDIDLTGRIQLEVISEELKSRYGIEAEFSPPAVIYKETIKNPGIAFASYTMPKPCWAVVEMRFEPLERGAGVVWDGGRVPNNQLFYRYQEHIKRSFFMSISQGNYGWEVTDFKATLTGGEHHTIHTHPLDFFVATPMAVRDGFAVCGTELLEPLVDARITAPEEYLGRIISDVTDKMRGSFDETPAIVNGSFMLDCVLPVSESLDYPIRLASVTSGKGSYYQEFRGYRIIPPELGRTTPFRGIDPADRAKWILYARGAITEGY